MADDDNKALAVKPVATLEATPANRRKPPPEHTRWKKGQSGNPSGLHTGIRPWQLQSHERTPEVLEEAIRRMKDTKTSNAEAMEIARWVVEQSGYVSAQRYLEQAAAMLANPALSTEQRTALVALLQRQLPPPPVPALPPAEPKP